MSLISIICPAYNEEACLPSLVERIELMWRTALPSYTVELLLVNDGSIDNTRAVMDQLALKYRFIKSIHHGIREGQTAALISGINLAQGDIIVTMDADLQPFPEDIPKLINGIEQGSDVVSGMRVNRSLGCWNKLCISIARILMRYFFGILLVDPSSSFRAFHSKFWQKASFCKNDHRYLIPILNQNGAVHINEIAVRWGLRISGKSKYHVLKWVMALPEFLAFSWRLKHGYYQSVHTLL